MSLSFVHGLSYAVEDQMVTVIRGDRAVQYRGPGADLLGRALPLLATGDDLPTVTRALGDVRLAPVVEGIAQRLVDDGFAVPAGAAGHTVSHHVAVAGDDAQVAAVHEAAPETWRVISVPLEGLADLGTQCHARLVWVTDPNSAEIAAWNERALRENLPWMPVNEFDGSVAIVGPYIEPGRSACFECFRRRRSAWHAGDASWLHARRLGSLTGGSLPRALPAAVATVVLDSWLTRNDPAVVGAVHAISPKAGVTIDVEYVLRVPRCGACRPVPAATRPTVWADYRRQLEDLSFDAGERH